MLNRIIQFSINNKLFILLGSVLIMLAGIYSANKMDIDVFPDLTAPTVVIITDSQGMAAEEVERQVTLHIETAVNGATDVRRVRSASMNGFSFVWVEFDWGTDIFKARQIVSEKMVTITAELPEGIEPVLSPQSSVMGEILFVGLQADSTSLMELRTMADWLIKPVILSTGGVSQVTIIGGDYKQYQIMADPMLMMQYKVTIEELTEVCKGMSHNSSGGVLREYGNEYMIRGIARTYNTDELGNTFIKLTDGEPVRVRDVAEVKIDAAQKMGEASMNGTPGVILSISKQPNINTLRVTERIENNLEALKKTLPADVTLDTHIFRQADFIETSVMNVQRALLEGAFFVIIILFLFLGSFRTTIISVLAIPISLMGGLAILFAMGYDINTMTLGGFCIAIGSLVDDAIIDVENVYKRLRNNNLRPKGERESVFYVVLEASKEIRASILNATIIIIVAFTPLFFLSGMEGRMLKPLGIAYVVSLLVSLIVAMTLTPLLCRLLLSDEKYLNRKSKEGWLSSKLNPPYERSLTWALGNKKLLIISSAGLLIVSLFVFFSMGRSFLPEFNEGSLTISAVSTPGISLTESDKIGKIIEKELLSIPEVESTARRTGRGELDEHSQTTNSAEIDVNYTLTDRDNDEFLVEVRSKLAGIPGIASTVGQPLGHRIDHMLSGTRANIAIKIFGNDLSQLFSTGNRVKGAITGIEGVVDVAVEQQTEIPQIQIIANREMLSAWGVTPGEFTTFVEMGFSGEKIGEIQEGQKSFDLVLKLNEQFSTSLEGIKSALVPTAAGGFVPLENIANVRSATGPGSISRENVQRKIVVSANVAGRDLRGAVEEIQKVIEESIDLPEGYRIEYGGQFESEARASKTLLLTSLLAICIIFLLLFQEFRSSLLAGIILLNLPLALIGGVFAVKLTSGIVSIPSIIGFITLFGIATRNGILLVSHYQALMKRGVSPDEAVIKGSLDRLNPILMTALTAALALVPLAINGNLSGNEIQSPMAIVILGGLLSSTLLNIFIVPLVYRIFAHRVHREL